MPNLPLIPGTLPSDCFPSSAQAFYNQMFQLGVAVQSASLTGVIVSDTEPGATDRDKVWIRTSAGAPVFPLAWVFYSGLWVAKHPVPAGALWAMPYTGSFASIPILDGGAAGAVSDNSGPFWEAVASLAARMPIGAGTLPSGTVLAVGDTGGEENHVLSLPELPKSLGTTIPTGGNTAGAGPGVFVKSNLYIKDTDTMTAPAGSDTGHNCLPPFLALTFLRRTSRKFCTQPIS